ncbi:MAG: DUF192 domain-containing protein [Cyanobacteriota bacterium]|nr:DUF192 domain-containing protein [Cyanobacteriota bacterium]
MGRIIGLFKSGIILFLLLCCLIQIIFVQVFNTQALAQNISDSQISPQGQILPITAKAHISNQIINLEVAKTPQEKAIGLMYRTKLADDRGMLFSFDPPRKVKFWMKNCLISLDIIFINSGIVQAIAENVPPCLADPCPTYGPDVLVDRVIEVRGRRAKELGLKVGDRIMITKI